MPGDVVLELPVDLRSELKTPLGPVYTDAERLLADATTPIVAVGDIVTYHLLEAGHTPAVALVDERTERETVEQDVKAAVVGDNGPTAFDSRHTATNPAGTLTADLLSTLRRAIDADESTLVVVDGEEDLATLPAILAVPDGASVVYGQPGEGMVLVTAGPETRDHARSLLERMHGEYGRARDALALR
ncbi:GTP-dependent dephospho-CoA kinase family protein [Halapricum hydrolyticum]|uniref:GTP-dependent dephospho-CoA kinase n=1 Tax=Halapricum hydrolyticum TaxID=2979991 RepID=A0AAE3LK04_9EURY|nr:GTP-dependent dephospho-CoA kinase family protein [Halapricum hydrolyticum]MCU4718964.1 GTP-dependent dephospho-CoA kinase family protein [Halapricum hydrolyticum]MCU4727893.1 GTP-dependent dephospho-CoA kinase family protein [Halapricum hydrolyticum]